MDLPQNSTARPELQKCIIPPNVLGSVLQAWNFFVSFDDYLTSPEFTKEELYAALMYNGDKQLDFIDEIHESLVNVLMEESNRKVKLESQKDCEDNPYMYLMRTLPDHIKEKLSPQLWTENLCECIRALGYDENLSETNKRNLELFQNATKTNYNKIDVHIKLKILTTIIDLIYETDVFHDWLSERQDSYLNLLKDKTDLQQALKEEESLYYELKAKIEMHEAFRLKEAQRPVSQNRSESLRKHKELSLIHI
eukprot:TRINITY_DN3313_c0_g2_i3.p1 TRINITY_DN3313_c0_g2~~TRINITY_DN3313_c0_g2_i3.p1  ORF type:complete len:252 (+),score=46.26 TRINITY_DN3313_c0_g2_i3:251-1006(+)